MAAPRHIGVVFLASAWACVAMGQAHVLPECADASGNEQQNYRDNCWGRLQSRAGIYTGEFRNNQMEGQGEFAYPNGDKYTGEFKRNLPNGRGAYIFRNKERYVGNFQDGRLLGAGMWYAANGSFLSNVIWSDGKYVATGLGQEASPIARRRDEIQLQKVDGLYVVPIRLNDAVTVNAVVDSGASTVYIPQKTVDELRGRQSVSDRDLLAKGFTINADGSKVPTTFFRIHKVEVGGETVNDVAAAIGSPNGMMLLGQSFLNRFASWSIDNERHMLILK